jgi:predicted MFS family arabinose efflux permease
LPIALTFVVRVVACGMLLIVKGPVPFWIYALAVGFTLVTTAVLTATLVATLYGVKHLGFITGFINTAHMIGGGVWAWVGGVVFDSTGNYDMALGATAIASGLAFIWTLLIQERRHSPPPVRYR